MPHCAFCSRDATLSGEHIWSKWMRNLFTGKSFTFVSRDEKDEITKQRRTRGIDLTAKVVCKLCNETWLSDIEANHARPALTDLILGRLDIPVDKTRANDIALFAFKTAVVVDYMRRGLPFFSRKLRYAFARSRSIPPDVHMWLARFLSEGRRGGLLYRDWPEGTLGATGLRIKLYACTYAVGHFVFQVVSARYTLGTPPFSPEPSFNGLAVPFWPAIPERFYWPPADVLRTKRDFDLFAERWRAIRLNVDKFEA
jgi:hypothetical protein